VESVAGWFRFSRRRLLATVPTFGGRFLLEKKSKKYRAGLLADHRADAPTRRPPAAPRAPPRRIPVASWPVRPPRGILAAPASIFAPLSPADAAPRKKNQKNIFLPPTAPRLSTPPFQNPTQTLESTP
jgi:hypothetical protein